jgi:hypothetical protein
LHVAGVFGFLMAHGVSAGVSFRLRSERSPEKVRALLELSAASYPVMYGSLMLLFVLGIVLGFMGSWWGRAWIWVSLVGLITLVMLMSHFGSRIYGGTRKLSGLPYMERGKPQPPIEPASAEEINAALDRGNPTLLTAIGFGGIVIIAWLMMFKPF